MQPIEGGRGFCVCGSEMCDVDHPLCLASAADPFTNACAPAGMPALPACAARLLPLPSVPVINYPTASLLDLLPSARQSPAGCFACASCTRARTTRKLPAGRAKRSSMQHESVTCRSADGGRRDVHVQHHNAVLLCAESVQLTRSSSSSSVSARVCSAVRSTLSRQQNLTGNRPELASDVPAGPVNQECVPFEGSPSDGTVGTCICGEAQTLSGRPRGVC